jgi:hypothetical protein
VRRRRRRNVHPGRSMVFMCMTREPSLELLLPALKAMVMVMMATLFSRRGPQPLVLGPRGQAPPMKLEIDTMKTWNYLSMCRWLFSFILRSAQGVTSFGEFHEGQDRHEVTSLLA